MLLGARSSGRDKERENITPNKTDTVINARSRKCLDLSLKNGSRGVPLAATQNLPNQYQTPRKGSPDIDIYDRIDIVRPPDTGDNLHSPSPDTIDTMGHSPGSDQIGKLSPTKSPPISEGKNHLQPRSPSLSPQSPLSLANTIYPGSSIIPSSVALPKTPHSVLADPIRRRNLASQSLTKSATRVPVRQNPRKPKGHRQLVAEQPEVEKQLPTIKASSFYSTKPLVRTPEIVINKPREAHSLPTLTRSSSRISLKRRSGAGSKRKSAGSLRGVGHGIKKPKIKPEPQHPVLKISELPAMSIEVPKSKSTTISPTTTTSSSAPCTPSTSSPGNPYISKFSVLRRTPGSVSGQLSITDKTKVQFEVTAGKFVYRTKAKAGTTPRRSPRKHMSPLKADYFRESKKRGSRTDSKKTLFSPDCNFLSPTPSQEEEEENDKSLPSPVKFHDTSQASEGSAPDLSCILKSLHNTDLQENTIDDKDCDELELQSNPATSLVTSSSEDEKSSALLARKTMEELSLLPAEPQMFTDSKIQVSTGVSSILDDLSSEEEGTDSSSQAGSIAEENLSLPEENGQSKLFPIFYKKTARSGEATSTGVSQQQGKRFLCSSLSSDQAFIDAGQEVGATVCKTCGAVYTIGDPVDEASHAAQHSGMMERLKLTGWKSERVVRTFPDGRVLCIRPGDDFRWWRKVEEALTVVDRDLGFSEVGIRNPDCTKVFIYVSERKIVGFLLGEQISQGYRILPPDTVEGGGRVYCCSDKPETVLCGISRIWVLAEYRRKKIASSLVDCMRSSFFVDRYLNETDFAFSDPTLHGIQFATNYMKTSNFLVYSR